jgi:Flp pilus assembly protein TadG
MHRLIASIPLLKFIAQLWRDGSGISLIYVTVALPALVGCALLAVDVGRFLSLHSSLQNAADSIALAAAGELDRAPDAITRADRAIANLVRNPTVFATSVATIDGSGVTRRYLKSLPTSDAAPITAANVAADPVEARYVEISVTPVEFTTLFPATFLGAATNTARLSAIAVAGFDAVVCDFTPLFMCNPYEPQNGTTEPLQGYGLHAHIQNDASRRRLMSFRLRDDNGQRQPGDYGFLDTGRDEDIGDLLAAVTPRACFSLNRLFTQRSREDDAREALNVRFDLYEGGRHSDHPPGVNVRKGYIVRQINNSAPASACNNNNRLSAFPSIPPELSGTLNAYEPVNGVMGLPRDSDCVTGCSEANGRMGNGDWGGDAAGSSQSEPDFEQYWTTNFDAPPIIGGVLRSNANLPTRFETYRHEIDNNLQDTSKGRVEFNDDPNPPKEYREPDASDPWCSPLTPVDEPDRRIIYGAIINCRAAEVRERQGGPYQGVAFGRFFMTEPVGQNGTLWVELIDLVRPGSSVQSRDMVQLYR